MKGREGSEGSTVWRDCSEKVKEKSDVETSISRS